MSSTARENSVNNLQRVYTVVISLAITEGLRRLFGNFASSEILPGHEETIALLALLFTIVPFYHGANRYLDERYIEASGDGPSWSLMLDFVVLFSQGLIFFVLSLLIYDRDTFFTLLSGLFVIDIIWVGITTASNESNEKPSFIKWAIINTIAAALIYLIVWSNLFSNREAGTYFLLFIAISRSVLDYITVWNFYYPPLRGDSYFMPVPLPAIPPMNKGKRKR